jgi:hypothetical protein
VACECRSLLDGAGAKAPAPNAYKPAPNAYKRGVLAMRALTYEEKQAMSLVELEDALRAEVARYDWGSISRASRASLDRL